MNPKLPQNSISHLHNLNKNWVRLIEAQQHYHHQIIPLHLSPTKCKCELLMMPTKHVWITIVNLGVWKNNVLKVFKNHDDNMWARNCGTCHHWWHHWKAAAPTSSRCNLTLLINSTQAHKLNTQDLLMILILGRQGLKSLKSNSVID
jgi:hypothetical protein